MSVTGTGCRALFMNEGGGHRWQRVPPTERRGRVHTSTVTVVMLDPMDPAVRLDPRECEVTVARGSGPGGQHRNKTESCVTVRHLPTGLTARADLRSQHRSREAAMAVLAARLAEHVALRAADDRDAERRRQAGTGMRGDKVRTYRTQEDQVTDHRTGRRCRLSSWLRGDWSGLDRM